MEVIEPQSLKKLSYKSLKRSLDCFSPLHVTFPPPDSLRKKIRLSHKIKLEYGGIQPTSIKQNQSTSLSASSYTLALPAKEPRLSDFPKDALVAPPVKKPRLSDFPKDALVAARVQEPRLSGFGPTKSSAIISAPGSTDRFSTAALMERVSSRWPRPDWHHPWKTYRVISGHLGWVTAVAFDPANSWFCSGSADRTIKLWDLASGRLKHTLTGHIGQVRGLAVSKTDTYLFSAGDDKMVKCWDLERNMVIRSFHGHLSGVYCLALHREQNLLLTGGRDSVCRVWDIRTNTQAFVLSGHENTVCSVFTRPTDPQVVTGSHDSTIKFWDLRYGKTMTTLTHHKKSVRALAFHPKLPNNMFASASADNIKKFSLPNGVFMHNMLSHQKTIINAMAVNNDGVLATAGDNGSLWFWDWKSGHNFHQAQTRVQPGSMDCEAGIYALSYDITGTRLVTCEADKTIKMWKQDEKATPDTHPLNFKAPKDIRRF